MRRFAVGLLIVIAGTGLPLARALSPFPTQFRISIEVPQSLTRANGVIANPASSSDLYREISAGAPTVRVTGARGTPGELARVLQAAGVQIVECGLQAGTLVHGTPQESCLPSRSSRTLFVSVQGAGAGFKPLDPDLSITFGAQNHTPHLLELPGSNGLVEGSITRRPGIVTPYDISATILAAFHIPQPASFVGNPLMPGGVHGDARKISSRLVRDSGYQQSLTAWTVIVGLGIGVLLAFFFSSVWLGGVAIRLATGAGFATAGYLLGLFVPSARGDVRAIFVFALLVIGASIKPGDPVRVLAKVFILVALATVVLEIASALHPQGEPALSFWGNPLVSWRWYGLYNYQAAFVAGGALVSSLFLVEKPWVLAGAVLGALIVTGAPMLGANFVGVLTLGFGGALAFLSARAQSIKPRYFAYAALFAVAAFGLSLLAGAAAGGSHGARAAHEISTGGTAGLSSLVRSRLRLNIEAMRAFPGGVAWSILFVFQFLHMIRWSMKAERESLGLRIAIAACSAAGLAALALEDSGFKMSAVQGFPALILWTIAMVRTRPARRSLRRLSA